MSYCNILNWFKTDKHYLTIFENLGQKMFLNFTFNPNGNIKISSMIVNEEDFTSELITHGGNDVLMEIVEDRKLAYDCNKVDYFLTWKVSGEVGKFIKEKHAISDMLLYANYNKDAKSYLYFAREWLPWQNAPVIIYDEKTTLLPDWINIEKLNNFEDKVMTTVNEPNINIINNEEQKVEASMSAEQLEANEKTVTATENTTNEDKINPLNNQDIVNATGDIIEENEEMVASADTEQPEAKEASVTITENADNITNESKDKTDFLDSSDTITAMKDAGLKRSQLEHFDLAKIKALTSYSVIKAINNKIYTTEQLFACDAQKIKLLTSEHTVNSVTGKVYTAEQLLGCDVEKIQALTSDSVSNALGKKIYTATQLLNCSIEKIQALISDQVTSAISDKVFTADQLLDCDSSKIRALTSKQTLDAIKPEKSRIDAVKEKAANIADKLGVSGPLNNLKDKVLGGAKEIKTGDELKDSGLYTAAQLLACETNKILALIDKVSQTIIVNKIYSSEQMLKFDVEQLEAFIAKANGYEDPESAVGNLGKVYFFALNGEQLPLRKLLEKENASANNNDAFESPLAVTVHAGFGPNAHLLVEHQGHFNHHDFVMDANYVNELIEYIPNILSKQEQKMAFTGFTKHAEVSNCVKTFEDWCLVESVPAVPSHVDL